MNPLTSTWAGLFAAAALLTGAVSRAQMPVPVPAEAPAQPGAIPLRPQDPDSGIAERWVKFMGKDYAVRNVTRPTITPFLPPAGRGNKVGVIVAPGGAFMLLAWDHEGTQVAKALAKRGVAAFVLKYRLNQTPDDEAGFQRFAAERLKEITPPFPGNRMPEIKEPRATEDALTAVRYVREHAGKFGVDPQRIGMIGFSAGAMTALNAGLSPDAAARPAFIAPIYPPMLAVDVPRDAPPMFVAIALDDELFGQQGFGLIESWHRAGRPVELHAYERGGHGFGLGKPGTTSTLMLDEFMAWLKTRGLPQSRRH